MNHKITNAALCAVVSLSVGFGFAQTGRAQDKPAPVPAWTDTIKVSGYIDAGIQGNPDSPSNGVNWGRLFDDRANLPVLNQASVIITRPTDPNATGYDYGFIFQPMFGTDARYTHFVGEFDRLTTNREQLTILEADALVHLPWLTSAGIDAKIGQFQSILSAEQTLPTANPFYSHSYIFNYGITVSHTGITTTTHLNPTVDIYAQLDTGNQTTLDGGDNNGAIAGLTGVGLNFLDGNITSLFLVHFGPENPSGAGLPFNVNSAFRYESTLTTVVKWNDDLTFTNDLNLIHDNGFHATGFGVAQYVAYAVNDWATFEARGEVWRDAQGFFVAAFPNSLDAVNALEGRPNTSRILGAPTTYGEVTLGFNVKPPVPVPAALSGALLRPEIRYDTTFNGPHAFDNFTKTQQFTIGADLLLPF
jgi:hypothetical protein